MMPLTDTVDALCAAWNTPDSPGCVLAVIKDGQIIYQRGYGMADLERHVALSPASVFDIASTGKQFTAMLIAILARQGMLSLDDSIHMYIPELPLYPWPVTIRHMIHHTSGVRDYTALMDLAGMHLENRYDEDELLDLICRQKELTAKPGDEFLYSNSGYFLLGVIAQRCMSKPFIELIRDYLLKPLGMHATDFNADAKRIVKNRAIGYAPADSGGYSTEISFCGGYGDGAILSTVQDLFLWDQHFYHNTLDGGGDGLIQEMHTVGVLNSSEKLDYAYGLVVDTYRGLRTVWHSGGWAGYRSQFIRFPEQHFSVICLANHSSIVPTQLAFQIADLYLADQFPEPARPTIQAEPESIMLPASQIERLIGSYRNQHTERIVTISIQAGQLIGTVLGQSVPLIATSSTQLHASEVLQIDFAVPPAASLPTIQVAYKGSTPEIYQKLSGIPAPLADYVGTYCSDELPSIYYIRLDNEQLFLRRGYAAKEVLTPISHDLFLSRDLDIQFERNEQNQVYAFKLGIDRVRNIRCSKAAHAPDKAR